MAYYRVSQFVASYAPTDRSTCHACHKPIAKGGLRVTALDGGSVAGRHYHVSHGLQTIRGWGKPGVNTDGITPADAKTVRAKLAAVSAAHNKRRLLDGDPAPSRFVASYAPSDRATCKACGKKIDKGSVRLTRVVGAECFTGHGASMPCHGIQLHYHAAHGVEVAEKVRCESKAPHVAVLDELAPADAKRLKAAFANAVAKRAVACRR